MDSKEDNKDIQPAVRVREQKNLFTACVCKRLITSSTAENVKLCEMNRKKIVGCLEIPFCTFAT